MFYPVIVVVIGMLSGEMTPFETSPPREQIPPQEGMKNISERALTYAKYTQKIEKWNKEIKSSHPLLKSLEWFKTKLQRVIEKYVELEKQEGLFTRVKICESKKCGDLPYAPTSEEIIVKLVKTDQKFKNNRKYLRKQILKSLSNLQQHVKVYEKYFEDLINFEEFPRFKEKDTTDGKRTVVLNELKKELRILQNHIEEIVKRSKRRNGGKSIHLGEPISQTGLIIKEWRVFINSKEYLQDYNVNIMNVIQQWREVRRNSRKKKHKKETNFLTTNNL